MEAVGLVVTVLFALIIAAKAGYLRAGRLRRLVSVGAWVVFAYFVLNIVGNLASTASLEKLIFTPVSVILAALAWRVAVEK